jgi:hypothetical protein
LAVKIGGKDLSKDCKNIVLNLFKIFQLENVRGRPLYSPDNLIKGAYKAADISYSSVYRVVNGKSPPKSNRPKERKKILHPKIQFHTNPLETS